MYACICGSDLTVFVCNTLYDTERTYIENAEQKPKKKGFVFLKIENECKRQESSQSILKQECIYFKNLTKTEPERQRERVCVWIREGEKK